MPTAKFSPLNQDREYCQTEIIECRKTLLTDLNQQQPMRDFSVRPFSRELIECCIRTAGTAVASVNMRPSHFLAVQVASVKQEAA